MLRAQWAVRKNPEDKNVESDTDDGGLACEVERKAKVLSGLELKNWLWLTRGHKHKTQTDADAAQLGLESAVLRKRVTSLGQISGKCHLRVGTQKR